MATNANVINGATYSLLAQNIANSINVTAGANNYLYTALTAVAALDSVDQEIDLIYAFNSTYLSQLGILASTTMYQQAARALNGHVLSRAVNPLGNPYTDINQWFDDCALGLGGNIMGTVPAGFALTTPLKTATVSDALGNTSSGSVQVVTVPNSWVTLCATTGVTINSAATY